MNESELLRFSKHILLNNVGIEGQDLIKKAHVVVVGLGGLGNPASLYLSSSGVGSLTIIDDDNVENSNLPRQILFGDSDVGKSKVSQAKEELNRKATQTNIYPINSKIEDIDNIEEIFNKATVVIDCCDNFKTRTYVSKLCLLTSTPLVFSSVIESEGQIATFQGHKKGMPCYNCVYKKIPEVRCVNNGVLAPAAGVMGSFQALEALKVIIDESHTSNKIVFMDLFNLDFRSIMIYKDETCQFCH
jgi:adenylyltransferase/sulfurtransferase